ncbi:MAG: sulfatase [Planctomycetota bacterium]
MSTRISVPSKLAVLPFPTDGCLNHYALPFLFIDSQNMHQRAMKYFFAILAFTALFSPVRAVESAERPNFVFLFLDDQAYFGYGASGNDQIKTPQMDRLASEGVMFTNHYNSTAICMASRASVMTGMYEYKTGCNFMHGPMRPETFELSYPVLLRDAGYRTGFGGKFGFAVTDKASESVNSYDVLPIDRFDAWAGGTGQTSYETAKNEYLKQYADRYPHSSRAYGAFAQDFIKDSAAGDKPFCLTLFFKAPHYPQIPDPFFDHVYENATFSKPENHGPESAEHLAPQSRMGRQFRDLYKRFGFDDEGYSTAIRKYYQQIYGVDYALGMLRDELDRQGIADDTIIILTSDNGYFCGAHGFGGKVLPYEEGSRVPLLILDPTSSEMTPGSRCDRLTATIDIAPTILDYAGEPAPKNMDGSSLRKLVSDPQSNFRSWIPLFQAWGTSATYAMAVVSPTHKYIHWPYAEGIPAAHELFDLRNDPLEMTNVIDDPAHQSQLQSLKSAYGEALQSWKDEAVPYHRYQEFGKIFDPEVGWESKRDLFATGNKNQRPASPRSPKQPNSPQRNKRKKTADTQRPR